MKRIDPWLGLTVLAALGLRTIGLASRPIWYDDAFSILLARVGLADIVRGTAADTMPPLYYFVLHVWQRLGGSIGYDRLLNVLLGVGLVVAVYGLASALFDVRTARWAAFLMAISPIQIYQAQEVRMYVVLCLGLVVYLWAIVRIWKGGGGHAAWGWAPVVLAGAGAAYSHNLAVFSLAAPAVYFLLAREGRMLAKLAGAIAAILVLFAPWLAVLPGQIAKIQAAFWTPRPGLLEVLQSLILFHGYLPLPAAAQAFVLIVSLAAPAFTLLTVLRTERTRESGLLLAVMFSTPLALFGISYLMRPVFVPRAFLLSHVVYLTLAARALVVARHPAVRAGLAFGFIAAAALSLPYQYAYQSFPRSPFPDAAASLETSMGPGDIVVHDNKLSFFPMIVYAPGLPQRFVADQPGSHNDTLAPATQAAMDLHPAPSIDVAAEGAGRLFFVVFDRALQEYRDLGLDDHPSLEWLREQLVEEGRTAFGDLWVYEFTR